MASKNNGSVPEATIARLPLYLNRLKALREAGIGKVSSRDLAGYFRMSASQLRHDFHLFGGFSRRGAAYDVDLLVDKLTSIILPAAAVPIMIAGVGNLGQAIASYTRFEEDGFRLAGLFDVNPKLIGLRIRDIPVEDLDLLPERAVETNARIGILTVPTGAAQEVTDLMVAAGIRGIWNFAPVELNVPESVIVQDEYLSVGIMSLSFKVKECLGGRREQT